MSSTRAELAHDHPKASVRWIASLDDRLHPLARRVGLRGTDLAAVLVAAMAVIVGLIAVNLGGEIYEAVHSGVALNDIDMPTLRWMILHRSGERNSLITGFTHLGGPTIFPVLLVAVLGGLALLRRSIHEPLVVLAGLGGALALTVLGKDLTGRARPDHAMAVPPYESTPSFPSGHTVIATVVAALVAYCVVRYVHSALLRILTLTLAGIWAIGMGLSRVYLGHHWLTDVAAGWMFALAWSAFVIVLDTAWRIVRSHHENPKVRSAR